MFSEKYKVRFSECDKNYFLTHKSIIDYFQDCSNAQSDLLGVGIDYLNNINRAWMMDFWQIEIKRRPKAFENIEVCTWANGFKGFFGTRNFLMKSEEEVIVCANSCWVYLDTLAGRPVKFPMEEAAVYEPEEPYDMEYVGRKIHEPEEMEYVDSQFVKAHHIDVYNHMNNARYVEMAMDYVENTDEIKRICCQYKMQARLGDEIRVFTSVKDEVTTIALKDTEDGIYAMVQITK